MFRAAKLAKQSGCPFVPQNGTFALLPGGRRVGSKYPKQALRCTGSKQIDSIAESAAQFHIGHNKPHESEGVIWEVPEPVPPSEHRIKYRLVYVRDGIRVAGYDNERGKGVYKHCYGTELPLFKDVPTLIRDFLQDLKEVEP